MRMSIACEFCNDMVSISLYPQHLRRCRIMHMFNDNEDNDDYDDDDNIIERHIRSGHQVYRSNVRSFLETHHSPPERRGVVMRQRQPQPQRNSSFYEDNMRLIETMGGCVLVGITDIDAVSSITRLGDNEVDAKCAICLENMFGENTDIIIRRLTRCQHVFCHGCIKEWLNIAKTCPMCKTDLSEKIDLMS